MKGKGKNKKKEVVEVVVLEHKISLKNVILDSNEYELKKHLYTSMGYIKLNPENAEAILVENGYLEEGQPTNDKDNVVAEEE